MANFGYMSIVVIIGLRSKFLLEK